MLGVRHFDELQGVLHNQDPLKARLSLEQSRDRFLALLDFPKPVQSERAALDSGSYEQYTISAEFKQEAFFLSSQLQLSEFQCAALLVEAGKSNMTSRGSAEVAVILFYEMRASILAALVLLFQKAQDPTTDYAFRQVLLAFLSDLFAAGFQAKLLNEIDRLQQHAATLTTQPSVPLGGQAVATFAPDIQTHRLQCLQDERNALGVVLYVLATGGFLKHEMTLDVAKWLAAKSDTDDAATLHVLVASLASLDPTRESQDGVPLLVDLFHKPDVCKSLHQQISQAKWQHEPMRALVLVQWTLFFSYACQNNTHLEQDTQIWEENVERDVYTALKLDAFRFLLDQVLTFRSGLKVSPFSIDFQPFVLAQIEVLSDTFISTMHQILKKLKNKEEDQRLGSYRSNRRGQDDNIAPRHDIATLFSVIETLYKDRPDSGVKFWLETEEGDRRLNAFLRWASDSKGNMATSFFDMLAALSCGERSASYAHQFLSANSSTDGSVNTLCSWSTLFGAISFYAGLFQAGNQGQEIPPEEVDSLRALAHLLTQVVQWSLAARAVLIDNQVYRPIQSIFALLIHPIRLDLKGDLLDAIAAFCVPDSSPALAADIARRCWVVLEQSQILPTWSQAASGKIEGGIVTELDTVETPGEQYPATIAFLNLLAALLHKQPSSLESLFSSSTTFPDNLGAPHRRAGLGPYVAFVIDTVLLRWDQRKYQDDRERWRVAEKCLTFVDNAFQNLKLQPILGNPNLATLQVLLQQPGIELLGRFLRSGPLLATVSQFASTPLDELTARTCPNVKINSVVLSMKILLHLYRLGPMFSELVVPYLAELDRLPVERAILVQGAQTLDDAVLQLPSITDVVPRLATLVNCDSTTGIPQMATELLTALSLSRGFSVVDSHFVSTFQSSRINRLVGFLSESEESERIASGFTRQLQHGDSKTQSAILQLFTSNLSDNVSYPNVAHYLLGFSFQHEHAQGQLATVDATGGRAGLAAVVALINSSDIEPIALEQCHRIIYQLCSHEFTCRSATRYLRSQDDFFVTGIASLPFGAPIASAEESPGLLHAQAWLMKSIALEINELVAEQQTERITRLLVALLNVRDREDDDNVMQTEQSLSCMLELLHSLTIEEVLPAAEVDLQQLSLLPAFNLQACLAADSSGVVLYDSDKISSLVQHRIRELQGQGQLKTVEQQHGVVHEARLIWQYASAENAKHKLEAARLHYLQGWNTILDVIMVKAVSYFAPADRYTLLLDLLETIVSLLDAKAFANEQADVLSSATVMLVTCLREEQIAQDAFGPIDRLPSIFKTTIRALLSPGVSTASRGRLFCVLSHFLRIPPPIASEPLSKFAAAFAADLGRILQLACRDALFADEVWQLLALSFLDGFYSVVSLQLPQPKLLSALAKHNFINNVILSLKHCENDLLACLAPEPESLNALFVYEAKMSFLIRVASSREGANAITEAQALAKLGQCEFLNAPLYEDHNLAVARDSFFPSIQQRYQQLLLPTLQFLVAYASHLTSSHAANRKRELFAFILSHKEAFVSVLHQIVSGPSLKLVEQASMILQLLALTAPLASHDEFTSPSSYGGLHAAVLTMAGTALDQTALDTLEPQTEQEESAAQDKSQGDSTAFEAAKTTAIDDLLHGLLAYLYAISSVDGKTRPVLTAEVADHANSIRRYPSLATCLVFVRKQTHILNRHLAGLGQVGEASKRRKLAGSHTSAISCLQLIEMALLLFLRHTQHYFAKNSNSSGTTTSQSKAAIQHAYSLMSSRLQEVSLTPDLLERDARAHEVLIDQVLRCCSDALAD